MPRPCDAQDKGVTDNDRRAMRAFLRSPQGNAAELLPQFAALCDQLAAIADKELAGQPLDSKERGVIREYGRTLARFHFYEGETCYAPRDDFACIAPVFDDRMNGKTLYAGVGRPEAIYVVLFDGKELSLHWGAVLSYREFSRASGNVLDDQKWQAEVNAAGAPPPPAWTASFQRPFNQQELKRMAQEEVARLREGKLNPEDLSVAGHEATLARIEWLLKKWQAVKTARAAAKKDGELTDKEQRAAADAEEAARIGEEECSELFEALLDRAVDEDVPDLLDKVLPAIPDTDFRIMENNLEYCLMRRDWTPYRAKLVTLLHDSSPRVAGCAAAVLGSRPEEIDVAALAKDYDRQPLHVREEYCYLIGQSGKPGPEGTRVLTAALRDKSWELRRRAAEAVTACRATSPEILALVRAGLDEERPGLAEAMFHAALALHLSDTAPQMLARLKQHVERSRLGKDDPRHLNLEDRETRSLTTELVRGLGEFKYLPAKDVLRAFVFPHAEPLAKYALGEAAYKALRKIEPQSQKQLLAEIFKDPRSPDYMLQFAIVEVAETDDLEYVKLMLPIFEDIRHPDGIGVGSEAEWAAWHITGILESASQRDPEAVKLFERIRDTLLKQTHGPAAGDAVGALRYFDPAAAARSCLSIALDKKLSEDARTRAIALLQEAPKPWPIRELLPLVGEAPEDHEFFFSVGYFAAQAVVRLSQRLDPKIPEEAQTLREVRTTLDDMLKGPGYEGAVETLTQMPAATQDPLLGIALNRALPYAVRAYVLSKMAKYPDSQGAKRLIPLLSETSQPDDAKAPIALCRGQRYHWDDRQ